MEIMNRDINVCNYACDIVCLFNINSRLYVLIYGIWSIGDFETKVLKDGSEILDHFGG